MKMKLDEKDIKILNLIQENCKLTAREIAKRINSPITTVFARIKRLEKQGIIKGYKAILNAEKLGKGTTAFILVSFTYQPSKMDYQLTQREVAKEIARLPEVQEVHIVTGNWDLLLKVRVRDVEELGKFIVDRLRLVRGVEKTLTCVVLSTEKETTEINL